MDIKTIEQSLLDGAIQGVVVLEEMWVFKEMGLVKKSTEVKALGIVTSVALSEIVIDYA